MTRGARAPRRLAAALAAVLAPLLVLLAGCGYHTGLTAPEGAKTVGVEFFGNDGPLRDLEVQLQSELSASIDRTVSMRIVDPRDADVVVRGKILDYRKRKGIRSPDNELLETGVRITVEATLIDPTRRLGEDGEPLPPRVLRKAVTSVDSGFRLIEPSGEKDARDRALRNLADRLALDLFGAVAYEPGEAAAQSQEPEKH